MATNTPTETPETKCFSCQVDDKRAAGEPVTQQEMNHWSMWGCTCTPDAEAAAIAFIAQVTR